MSHTLISLMGRTSYRSAKYRFDNNKIYESQFFGLPLVEYLRDTSRPIDKMVIIGTDGSSWHNLVSLFCGDEPPAQLEESAQNYSVTQEELHPWISKINENPIELLKNIQIKLLLTDYATQSKQQFRQVKKISDLAGDAERITFDITHSLRHLPLLTLMAALVLHRLNRAHNPEIAIYYGALEMIDRTAKKEPTPDPYAPVIRLDGLLEMVDFLVALGSFQKDGDYAVFAELMGARSGQASLGTLLGHAAYQEHIGQFAQAKDSLLRFLRDFDAKVEDGNAMKLLQEPLQDRFSWLETDDLYGYHREQALLSLKYGDLRAASLWAREALVTRLCLRCNGLHPEKPNDRQRIANNWRNALQQAGMDADYSDFQTLRTIRNLLAHGEYGSSQTPRTMQDRQSCTQALHDCIKVLLPEKP